MLKEVYLKSFFLRISQVYLLTGRLSLPVYETHGSKNIPPFFRRLLSACEYAFSFTDATR